MRLSANTKELKPSATLVINETVRKKRETGEYVLNFGLGESPFPVHANIRKKLCENADKKSYLPVQGIKELREKISIFYKVIMGLAYKPEQIIVGPGSKILLYDAMTSLDGPLFLPAPSWVSYQHQARLLGKDVFHVLTRSTDSYRLTPQALEQALDAHSPDPMEQKLLLLNYPCNPTGHDFTAEQLKELAEIAKKYNVIVLSDEIYGLISFNEKKHQSIAEYYPEGTIITGGISKDRSLGGYRLGVALLPEQQEELLRAMLAVGSETWSCVSAPIQHAAIEAYDINDANLEYINECTSIHEIVAKYVFNRLKNARINCPASEGAFYLFPDWNEWKEELTTYNIDTSLKLSEALLNELNIAALPGSEFGMPENDLSIRISLVDYDGEYALKIYRENREEAKKNTTMFIRTIAPRIARACDQLESFMTNITILSEKNGKLKVYH
ncbi:MAG: pyridoxal phosphate-dependent aminotransferase [Candidatus Odinarchaeota archaeon]